MTLASGSLSKCDLRNEVNILWMPTSLVSMITFKMVIEASNNNSVIFRDILKFERKVSHWLIVILCNYKL